MTAPNRDQHLAAVESDYDARVNQWRTIYDGVSFHDHTIRARLERTLSLAGAGDGRSALDVGCGAGQLMVELADRGWTVAGTDLSAGMVDETQDRLRAAQINGEVRQANAEQLPFADGSFELVTALGLIEYLPDPMAGLAEMRRVLRTGGRLIVTVPNKARAAYLADPVSAIRRRMAPPAGGYPRRYWTVGSFSTDLRASGLQLEHLEGHGIGPFTFFGRPLTSEERAIHLGERLEARLPQRAAAALGANLIAVARR